MRSAILSALLAATTSFACAHATHEGTKTGGDDALAELYRAAYNAADAAPYQAARDAYAGWLADHGSAGDKEARQVRLRYAKLLFALGDFARSADEFAAIVRTAPGGQPDYLARTSARNAVVALQLAAGRAPARAGAALRLLRDEGVLETSALEFTSDPIVLPTPRDEAPIAAAERALADACDRYVSIADSTDPALTAIDLIAADIYFQHGHAAEAADRCARIVARAPQSDTAADCARATVDALGARKAWAELERHARAYRGNLSLIGADHELERQLDRVLQFSIFNRIQSEAEAHSATPERLIKGAEAFRSFQREFPYSANGDKALYNAFVYFTRAGKKSDAIAAGKALLAQYSDSPLARDVKRALAELERATPDNARAAR